MSLTAGRLVAALAVSCTAAFAACDDDPESGERPVVAAPDRGWLAPSTPDAKRVCADVGEVRACWGAGPGECFEGVCLVERPVPDGVPAPSGWRCHGSGAGRRCVPRERRVAPFECDGGRCARRYPRLPDTARWECSETHGVVLCRGGEPAAGVHDVQGDPAWRCGERLGGSAERLCLDLSPDFPEGGAASWRCRFTHERGERRLCAREEREQPGIGAACGPGRACPEGGVCAGGRCLPRRPDPECWLDEDCAGGSCKLGVCLGNAAQ